MATLRASESYLVTSDTFPDLSRVTAEGAMLSVRREVDPTKLLPLISSSTPTLSSMGA